MDDIILQELKRTVEQTVRPVRATMARKRRMREELLAHLVAIFEEEVGKLGDERVALAQAKRRFGDPRELTGQLQQAVPRLDRCRSILENMGCQPSESAWHLARRHFLAMLTIYGVILPVGLPIMMSFGQFPHRGPAEVLLRAVLALTLIVLVAALVNTAISLLLAPLLNKIGPALARTRWGRILLVVLCALMLPFTVSGAFAGAALVFILMVRQAAMQSRYQADWA